METGDHLKQQQQDHELLIRIDEQVKIIIRDMGKMAEAVTRSTDEVRSRVAILDANKLDKEEAYRLNKDSVEQRKDHEQRVQILEERMQYAMGGLKVAFGLIVVAILPLVIYIWNTRGNVNDQVRQGVADALSAYDVVISNE